MVRRNLKIALIFLAAMVAAVALFSGWLFGTSSGLNWLLDQVPRWTPVTVRAQQVDGRLAGPLRFRGLNVSWPDGRAEIDHVTLEWQPLKLLSHQLAITKLEAEEVRIVLSKVSTTPSLEPGQPPVWPRLSGWPLRWDAAVERFAVNGLTVTKDDEKVLALNRGRLKIEWHSGILTLSGVDLQTPEASLAGRLQAGFADPSLKTDLVAETGKSSADPKRWTLQADLRPFDSETMRGPAHFSGTDLGGMPLQADAELAMAGSLLEIHRLAIGRSGRKGELTGTGRMDWTSLPLHWKADMAWRDLDLVEEIGRPTNLAGTGKLSGEGTVYSGDLEILNLRQGWEGVRLDGKIDGDGNGLRLSDLEGVWLGGSLAGKADISWTPEVEINTTLALRELDPAQAIPDWAGSVSLDLDGFVLKSPDGEWHAQMMGDLLDSRLRGQPLRGGWDVAWTKGDLRVNRLDLVGEGFSVKGAGALAGRLTLRADVSHLDALLPGATGTVGADGWLRWQSNALSGEFQALGTDLAFDHSSARRVDLKFRGTELPGKMDLFLKGSTLTLAGKPWDALELTLAGAPAGHRAELVLNGPEGLFRTTLAGGYGEGVWQGMIESLRAGPGPATAWNLVRPASLKIAAGALELDSIDLENAAGGRARLSLLLADGYRSGNVAGDWWDLDLAVIDPWLPIVPDWNWTGSTTGGIEARWNTSGELDLAGQADLKGTLTGPNRMRVFLEESGAVVRWGKEGLSASLEVKTRDEGTFSGMIDSDEPGRLGLPTEGTLAANWNGFDLATLQPWLGPGLLLSGSAAGDAAGSWQSAGQFNLRGGLRLADGEFTWQTGEGEVTTPIRDADVNWSWDDERLWGKAGMNLGEVGNLQGEFSLPLPSRLPLEFTPGGSLAAGLTGRLQEQGVLGALFPGLVQETHGTIGLNLTAGGTWEKPLLAGQAHLEGASAYLPAAGIRLEGLDLEAQLEQDRIRIVTARVKSGEGQIEATGTIGMDRWRPVRSDLEIHGQRFQAVNLPGFTLLASPDLKITGNSEHLSVRGEIAVPELKITRLQEQPALRQHADVMIMGETAPPSKAFFPALDLQVKVILGDQVLVKMGGIDARLVGDAILQQQGDHPLTAKGEIRVAKGKFARYGVDLNIERGRVLFAGPVDLPTLDILAVRKIEDVKAGVRVTGNAKQPVIALYSDPAMDDIDRLGYIVLGHPMSESGGEASLLMAAAGGLLSQGESATLQSQLQKTTGLDLIAVEGGEEPEQSVVTLGKYLSPRLYVSFGQSLFTPSSEFRVRYTLSKHFEVESKVGDTSGADLYYKVEFE